MTEPAPAFTPPSVVVGVDGSQAAERAARWAVDEAVGRELPLHLLAATDGSDTHRAEAALQSAADAVTGSARWAAAVAAGRPVALSTELVTGTPAAALHAASRTAAMICVGAVGREHGRDRQDHPVGSTVGALAASALCPLAVVRSPDERQGRPSHHWVVVELDESPDSAAVLQYAVEEARLRRAPLRVLGTWQSDAAGGATVDEGNRLVRAQLDRRLEIWRHRYPDLDVEPVAAHGSGLNYLSSHAAAIQLTVIGARNVIAVNELLGPTGLCALPDTSVLIVERQRIL